MGTKSYMCQKARLTTKPYQGHNPLKCPLYVSCIFSTSTFCTSSLANVFVGFSLIFSSLVLLSFVSSWMLQTLYP